MLLILETGLILATSDPLGAQAPAAATTPPPTKGAAAWGILDSPVVFEWKSGDLSSFLDQIKEVFGFDLRQRADIPNQMLTARVPSIKIKTARVWQVLELYNSISADYPGLGKWVVNWMGVPFAGPNNPQSGPTAVFLVAPKQTDAQDSLFVRAFSLRGISSEEQKLIFELINVERDRLEMLETERGTKPSLLRGDFHIHKETEICVATGSKTYVEMVGSLIDAFRAGRKFGYPARPDSIKPQDEK